MRTDACCTQNFDLDNSITCPFTILVYFGLSSAWVSTFAYSACACVLGLTRALRTLRSLVIRSGHVGSLPEVEGLGQSKGDVHVAHDTSEQLVSRAESVNGHVDLR